VRALEWFRLFFHLLLVEQLQTPSNVFFCTSCGMLLMQNLECKVENERGGTLSASQHPGHSRRLFE
jgi:hypothetical protein